MNSTVDCVNYVSGSNIVNIDGVGGVVDGVNQQLTISVNAPCVAKKTQSADYANKLSHSVAQALSKKSVALTQWLDNSQNTIRTHIADNVSTNVDSTTVQNCMNKIDSHNIVNVGGVGNIAKNIVQKSTTSLVSSCMSSNAQAAKGINGITDAVSQTANIKSANPLDFITHMFDSVVHGGEMMIFAVVFIVLICVIGIFMLVHHEHREHRAPTYVVQQPVMAAR
jgi:hypothetical protein